MKAANDVANRTDFPLFATEIVKNTPRDKLVIANNSALDEPTFGHAQGRLSGDDQVNEGFAVH